MSLARNVLPVPVSPSISTVTSWAAAMSSCSTIAVSDGVWTAACGGCGRGTVSLAGSANGTPGVVPRRAQAVSSRSGAARPTARPGAAPGGRAPATAAPPRTPARRGWPAPAAAGTRGPPASTAAQSPGSAASSSKAPSVSGVSRFGTSSKRTTGAVTWSVLLKVALDDLREPQVVGRQDQSAGRKHRHTSPGGRRGVGFAPRDQFSGPGGRCRYRTDSRGVSVLKQSLQPGPKQTDFAVGGEKPGRMYGPVRTIRDVAGNARDVRAGVST